MKSFIKTMFKTIDPNKANGVVQKITKTQMKTPYALAGVGTVALAGVGLSLKDGYTRNKMGKIIPNEGTLSNMTSSAMSPVLSGYQNGEVKYSKSPLRELSTGDMVDGSIVMSLHNMR